MGIRKIALIVVSILMAALVVGCSKDSYTVSSSQGAGAPAAAKTTVPQDTAIHLGDVADLGDYTVVASVASYAKSSYETGKAVLSVLLTITAKADAVDYNEFYVKVTDAEGYQYDMAFMDGKDPSFKSGELNKGQVAKGYVNYSVPTAVLTGHGVYITYKSLLGPSVKIGPITAK